jgi:hypothetical protein
LSEPDSPDAETTVTCGILSSQTGGFSATTNRTPASAIIVDRRSAGASPGSGT